ncbi:MAG: DNA mismatch endonuclease Vsr [Hyphomicrobiales bacterium]|nr:DNA mismatch endonuclease Vsr [Hyphomicrobiales bacterium]
MKTDPARSALMKRVRRIRTTPEELVSEVLRALGVRYRRAPRKLPGSPDFANQSRKWALFVNGCFWHHHARCKRATIPTRNRSFWTEKFADNRRRDAAKKAALEALGFRVLTVWECQTNDPASLARKLSSLHHSRG